MPLNNMQICPFCFIDIIQDFLPGAPEDKDGHYHLQTKIFPTSEYLS